MVTETTLRGNLRKSVDENQKSSLKCTIDNDIFSGERLLCQSRHAFITVMTTHNAKERLC